MTKIQAKIAQDFVTPCLHQFITVLGSSVAVYLLVTQLTLKSDQISLLVVGIGLGMIGACAVGEFAAISYIAMSARGSKEFIWRMRRKHGTDKWRRRVLAALLPNSINLEFINSLDTLVNGLRMKYFLSFIDRVTDNTITLLFERG